MAASTVKIGLHCHKLHGLQGTASAAFLQLLPAQDTNVRWQRSILHFLLLLLIGKLGRPVSMNLLVHVQFRRDTVPALQELIQPVLDGPPHPLTDTVAPQQLADVDSRFLEVDGVTLHYKERGPTRPDVPVVVLLHGFNGSVFNWCEPACLEKMIYLRLVWDPAQTHQARLDSCTTS